MAELASTPVFELDVPENIAEKQARVRDIFGQVPGHVHLVPIDFEREDLAIVLAAAGYTASQRTFFVWEAVTQYLSEQAVRSTFDFLAKAGSGSRLVFTYIRQDFLDGINLYNAGPMYQRFRVKQKLWIFGMVPEQVAGFLRGYGWQELEQMGGREFAARYVRPAASSQSQKLRGRSMRRRHPKYLIWVSHIESRCSPSSPGGCGRHALRRHGQQPLVP